MTAIAISIIPLILAAIYYLNNNNYNSLYVYTCTSLSINLSQLSCLKYYFVSLSQIRCCNTKKLVQVSQPVSIMVYNKLSIQSDYVHYLDLLCFIGSMVLEP